MRLKRTKLKITVVLVAILAVSFTTLSAIADSSNKIRSEDLTQSKFTELTTGTDPENIINYKSREDLSLDKNNQSLFEDKKVFTSGPIASSFVFNAVAPHFNTRRPEGSSILVEIRTSMDGENFTEWIEIEESDGARDEIMVSEFFAEFPVFSQGKYAQYRLTLLTDNAEKTPVVSDFSLNFINSEPTTAQKFAKAILGNDEVTAAGSGPTVISRAGWDCPDPNNTQFQGTSKYWPAEYEPVTHMIVHHSAGSNDPDAGASTVRAIWQYHAVTRGYGDIGYNFVVDWKGRLYEGRYGGDNVIAGHALHYNTGSMGVAMLGDFSSTTPPAAGINGLVDLLGYRASKYGINPLTTSVLNDKKIYHISGHRDVNSTSCPGDRLYGKLGSIRTAAANRAVFYSLKASAFSLNFTTLATGQTGSSALSITNDSPTDLTNALVKVVATNLTVGGGYSFPAQTISLTQGQTQNLTFNNSWSVPGNYKAWPAIYQNGKWNVISSGTGVPSSLNFSIKTPSSVILETASINPVSPAEYQTALGQFTLTNTTSLPLTLDSAGVGVNKSSGGAHNFPAVTNITLAGGESKTFSTNRTFTLSGSYVRYGYFYFNGKGYQATPLSSFSVLPITQKLVASNFAISPSNPVAGQTINATLDIKNNLGNAVSLSRVGLSVHDPNGATKNFTELVNLNFAIGETKQLVLSGSLGAPGSYIYHFYYYTPVKGYALTSDKTLIVSPVANKINVSNFTITPSAPISGQETTASFTITNNAGFDINFDSYGVAVRDPAGVAVNFPVVSNATIANGQSANYSMKRTFGTPGNHYAYAYFYIDGVGYRATSNLNFNVASVSNYLSMSISNIAPSSPGAGEPAKTTATLKNNSSITINFDSMGVAVRNSDGTVYNFDPLAPFVLTSGQTKSVEFERTFPAGSYYYYGYYYVAGRGYRGTANKNFTVSPNTLTATSFTVSPSTFSIGETVNSNLTLKNTGTKPISVARAGVAVKDAGGNTFLFDTEQNFSLAPGESKAITKPYRLPALGSLLAWGYYYAPTGVRVTGYGAINSHLPKLTVTSGLTINPQYPLAGQSVTATFTIRNDGNRNAVLDSLGAMLLFTGDRSQLDFDFAPKTLAPGESYQYESDKTLSATGGYTANVRYLLVNGSWYTPGVAAQGKTATGFTVYQNPADIRLDSGPTLAPSPYIQGQQSKATFTLKNLADQPIELDKVGFAARDSSGNVHNFPELTNQLIQGNSTRTFELTKSFTKIDTYDSWVYYYKNGGVVPKRTNGATQVHTTFQVTSIEGRILNTSSSISPSPVKVGVNTTGAFSLKSTVAGPITLRSAGIAVRFGSDVVNFPEFNNITLAAGETKTFSNVRNFASPGTYSWWIYYYDEYAGYKISDTRSFNVVASAKLVTLTSAADYLIKDKNGTVLDTVSAGKTTSVSYSGGNYSVTTPNKNITTSSYIVTTSTNGVMKITSYSDVPSWNTSLNDNEFRDKVIIQYSTVSNKLWVVNRLTLEHYLYGVAETSSSSPTELLKTMSVAARSYAYCHAFNPSAHCDKHGSEIFDLVNSRNGNGNDQQYRGYGLEKRFPLLVSAVNATAGKVVTYNGTPVITPYYSRSDGRTRSAQEVFGWTDAPWLVSVSDPDSAGESLLGHGVGLPGDGASARAGRGIAYASILSYYYTGTSIGNISNNNISVSIYGFTP